MDSNQLITASKFTDVSNFLEVGGVMIQFASSAEKQVIVHALEGSSFNLKDILTKPILETKFAINAGSTEYVLPIRPSIFQINPLYEALTPFFMSPVFDMEVESRVSGHQFAVMKLGAAFSPCLITGTDLHTGVIPNVTDTYDPVPTSIIHTYNSIRNLNGLFWNTTDGSNSVKITCNLPRTVPFNNFNIATEPNEPTFGVYYLKTIGLPTFANSVTEVIVDIVVRMVNISMRPFNPA